MGNEKVRVGVIGLGDRATELMRTMFATEDILVTVLCDPDEVRLETGRRVLYEAHQPEAWAVSDYG